MSADDVIGTVLENRYQVVRLLGQGGMGAVYEGRHVVVGKRVAIKLLHSELASSEKSLKRFHREAQAAAAIGHGNIIDIIDVGTAPSGAPFLVMEYLEGEDLDSMLRREGPLSLEATCGILEPVLLALHAAHGKGIVHRDLKPANIFLARVDGGAPVVKLIDFGISKFTSGTQGRTKLTRTGSLLGSPAYMSPEQARGVVEVDHRTDVYAMGVIVYRMLTGAMPYDGDNYNAFLFNMLTTSPRPLREANPAVPTAVESLVLKELCKDPSARSQSALEMLEAFQRLAAYAGRGAEMTVLGTRLEIGVAKGDLGERGGFGSKKSSASPTAQDASGFWAETAVRSGPSKALVAGLATAAAVGLAIAAMVAMKQFSPPATPATPPTAAPEVAPGAGAAIVPAAVPGAAPLDLGVQITLRGAPANAAVIFDGAPIPTNPFRVKRAETYKTLELTAPGYAPFSTSIQPSRDLAVEVRMTEATAPEALSERGSENRPTKAGGGRGGGEDTGGAARAEPKLSRDNKGTLVSSDFE